jgi:hypothetical protein
MTTLRVKVDEDTLRGVGLEDLSISAVTHNFSESNLPWAYTSTAQFREDWPSNVTVVPIQTSSPDFWTNLRNTVNAANSRVVVELEEGVYRLSKFRVIGSGSLKSYSFGFWFPNLRGFVGQGPDKTFIQLDANATTVDLNGTTDVTTQVHTEMSQMTQASYAPIQRGLCRIDGTPASPVILAGLTFRAADQRPLTQIASDLTGNIFLPQPSPHNGVNLYSNTELAAYVSYVRFQAAGRAVNSQPPFETANAQTGKGTVYWKHCEFDGRRSPDLDPNRPRRCGPVMVNGETLSDFTECWFHHSNVSRYAANDQNRDFAGQYKLTRCKLEQITNTQNVDPALNNGNSLGGFTHASPFGWESSNATITITDCIMHQDNGIKTGTGQIPMIYQLTSPGARNPQGGRHYVYGGEYHWPAQWPWLEGFVGYRISPSTYWWSDGFNTTLHVYHKDGQRLSPYVVGGNWPPTASALASARITPQTHYLIRSTS